MMLLPTHLLGGLIIGKITGDYSAALVGVLFVDLDHFISYVRSGILFDFRKLTRTVTNKNDPYGDQRGILHNIVLCLVISVVIAIFNSKVGFVFALGYLSHLILDALDNSDYFPFFPNKKINWRGPIGYFSTREIILATVLLIVFVII